MARLGGGDRSGQLYAYAWMALTNPPKDIVSISTGFSSIPSLLRFRGCPLGFCIGTRIRPIGAGARPGSLEAGQFRADAEMCFCQRALRVGWRPATPASVVEDRDLRSACSRLYHSPQVGRRPSGNLPRPNGKDSLSQALGVTAVELMPVQEFNETSVARSNPQTRQPLRNYWGYDPVTFFAPKASYSSSGGLGQQKLEFKEMSGPFTRLASK